MFLFQAQIEVNILKKAGIIVIQQTVITTPNPIPTAWINNEKLREQNYKEAVRANNPEALVAIIKMIYQRKQKRLAQGKKCTATDARYFQIAENLLYMELGVALEKPKQEICKTIIDYIDQNKID